MQNVECRIVSDGSTQLTTSTCHCEPRRGVAISRYDLAVTGAVMLRHRPTWDDLLNLFSDETLCQEIATGASALAMTWWSEPGCANLSRTAN